MRIGSKKIIFFLFSYYLCLDPILYMLSCYFTKGNIFGNSIFLSLFYLEQVVFVSTILLILGRNINVGKYLNYHTKWAFILFIWMCFVIMASYFDVGLSYFGQYYSFSNIIVGRGFSFILLGLNIHVLNDMFQGGKTRLTFYTITTIYFAFILLSTILNPLADVYPWYLDGITRTTLHALDHPESKFDYLYISNTVALLLLFIMSRVKNISVKLLIIIFGSYLILLSGSRAALACFAAAGIINCTILFLRHQRNTRRLLSATIASIFITLAIVYGPLLDDQVNVVYGEKYRFNPYTLAQSDEAYHLRGVLFEAGLQELQEVWIFGRYMSDVVEGRSGTYIHNWLSFWTNFGIGPFLLSVILIISALYKSTRQFLEDSNSPVNELLFLWSIYMIMLIVVARSHEYYYIWFILLGSAVINRRFTSKSVHMLSPSKT